ncbi:MAG: DNA-deoxyinosine glycosylase [Lachnospiraceae bacterium]|nr:DNA-deoxyinosine glycosylase [Lachnospiraceae bacterium]
MIIHPIPPIYDKNSEILILGSFPSVKSREEGFFYGHPKNRFWKVISAVFGENEPRTVEEKKTLLLRNHIALWDVIGSCDIEGSSDSSIRNVSPNELGTILECADIRQIYVNGQTAYKYYRKYSEEETGRSAICLPSTSPANAAWSLERLIEYWSCTRDASGR